MSYNVKNVEEERWSCSINEHEGKKCNNSKASTVFGNETNNDNDVIVHNLVGEIVERNTSAEHLTINEKEINAKVLLPVNATIGVAFPVCAASHHKHNVTSMLSQERSKEKQQLHVDASKQHLQEFVSTDNNACINTNNDTKSMSAEIATCPTSTSLSSSNQQQIFTSERQQQQQKKWMSKISKLVACSAHVQPVEHTDVSHSYINFHNDINNNIDKGNKNEEVTATDLLLPVGNSSDVQQLHAHPHQWRVVDFEHMYSGYFSLPVQTYNSLHHTYCKSKEQHYCCVHSELTDCTQHCEEKENTSRKINRDETSNSGECKDIQESEEIDKEIESGISSTTTNTIKSVIAPDSVHVIKSSKKTESSSRSFVNSSLSDHLTEQKHAAPVDEAFLSLLCNALNSNVPRHNEYALHALLVHLQYEPNNKLLERVAFGQGNVQMFEKLLYLLQHGRNVYINLLAASSLLVLLVYVRHHDEEQVYLSSLHQHKEERYESHYSTQQSQNSNNYDKQTPVSASIEHSKDNDTRNYETHYNNDNTLYTTQSTSSSTFTWTPIAEVLSVINRCVSEVGCPLFVSQEEETDNNNISNKLDQTNNDSSSDSSDVEDPTEVIAKEMQEGQWSCALHKLSFSQVVLSAMEMLCNVDVHVDDVCNYESNSNHCINKEEYTNHIDTHTCNNTDRVISQYTASLPLSSLEEYTTNEEFSPLSLFTRSERNALFISLLWHGCCDDNSSASLMCQEIVQHRFLIEFVEDNLQEMVMATLPLRHYFYLMQLLHCLVRHRASAKLLLTHIPDFVWQLFAAFITSLSLPEVIQHECNTCECKEQNLQKQHHSLQKHQEKKQEELHVSEPNCLLLENEEEEQVNKSKQVNYYEHNNNIIKSHQEEEENHSGTNNTNTTIAQLQSIATYFTALHILAQLVRYTDCPVSVTSILSGCSKEEIKRAIDSGVLLLLERELIYSSSSTSYCEKTHLQNLSTKKEMHNVINSEGSNLDVNREVCCTTNVNNNIKNENDNYDKTEEQQEVEMHREELEQEEVINGKVNVYRESTKFVLDELFEHVAQTSTSSCARHSSCYYSADDEMEIMQEYYNDDKGCNTAILADDTIHKDNNVKGGNFIEGESQLSWCMSINERTDMSLLSCCSYDMQKYKHKEFDDKEPQMLEERQLGYANATQKQKVFRNAKNIFNSIIELTKLHYTSTYLAQINCVSDMEITLEKLPVSLATLTRELLKAFCAPFAFLQQQEQELSFESTEHLSEIATSAFARLDAMPLELIASVPCYITSSINAHIDVHPVRAVMQWYDQIHNNNNNFSCTDKNENGAGERYKEQECHSVELPCTIHYATTANRQENNMVNEKEEVNKCKLEEEEHLSIIKVKNTTSSHKAFIHKAFYGKETSIVSFRGVELTCHAAMQYAFTRLASVCIELYCNKDSSNKNNCTDTESECTEEKEHIVLEHLPHVKKWCTQEEEDKEDLDECVKLALRIMHTFEVKCLHIDNCMSLRVQGEEINTMLSLLQIVKQYTTQFGVLSLQNTDNEIREYKLNSTTTSSNNNNTKGYNKSCMREELIMSCNNAIRKASLLVVHAIALTQHCKDALWELITSFLLDTSVYYKCRENMERECWSECDVSSVTEEMLSQWEHEFYQTNINNDDSSEHKINNKIVNKEWKPTVKQCKDTSLLLKYKLRWVLLTKTLHAAFLNYTSTSSTLHTCSKWREERKCIEKEEYEEYQEHQQKEHCLETKQNNKCKKITNNSNSSSHRKSKASAKRPWCIEPLLLAFSSSMDKLVETHLCSQMVAVSVHFAMVHVWSEWLLELFHSFPRLLCSVFDLGEMLVETLQFTLAHRDVLFEEWRSCSALMTNTTRAWNNTSHTMIDEQKGENSNNNEESKVESTKVSTTTQRNVFAQSSHNLCTLLLYMTRLLFPIGKCEHINKFLHNEKNTHCYVHEGNSNNNNEWESVNWCARLKPEHLSTATSQRLGMMLSSYEEGTLEESVPTSILLILTAIATQSAPKTALSLIYFILHTPVIPALKSRSATFATIKSTKEPFTDVEVHREVNNNSSANNSVYVQNLHNEQPAQDAHTLSSWEELENVFDANDCKSITTDDVHTIDCDEAVQNTNTMTNKKNYCSMDNLEVDLQIALLHWLHHKEDKALLSDNLQQYRLVSKGTTGSANKEQLQCKWKLEHVISLIQLIAPFMSEWEQHNNELVQQTQTSISRSTRMQPPHKCEKSISSKDIMCSNNANDWSSDSNTQEEQEDEQDESDCVIARKRSVCLEKSTNAVERSLFFADKNVKRWCVDTFIKGIVAEYLSYYRVKSATGEVSNGLPTIDRYVIESTLSELQWQPAWLQNMIALSRSSKQELRKEDLNNYNS